MQHEQEVRVLLFDVQFSLFLRNFLRQAAFVMSGVNCLDHLSTLSRRNFRKHRCLGRGFKQQSLPTSHREPFLDVTSILNFQVAPLQLVQASNACGAIFIPVSLWGLETLPLHRDPSAANVVEELFPCPPSSAFDGQHKSMWS